MDFENKINFLRKKIEDALIPLIDHDYVLWECPYYCNIGDVLIWEGELEFLKKVKYKCIKMASQYTCDFPILSPDILILLQGGGNFGDLWRSTQEFRLKVCQMYPNNKIIIFPQTVFYEAQQLLYADAQILSQHQNLTICCRDEISYQLVSQHFKNKILLLPDMAFCISTERLQAFCVPEECNKGLFLKRTDKEFPVSDFLISSAINIETHDWPTYERKFVMNHLFETLLRVKEHFNLHFLNRFIDHWAFYIYRKYLVKIGVRFLSQYGIIYTTRLHVFILGILLHKKCIIIDNSYGKNSSFFHTWLKDLEHVEMLPKE